MKKILCIICIILCCCLFSPVQAAEGELIQEQNNVVGLKIAQSELMPKMLEEPILLESAAQKTEIAEDEASGHSKFYDTFTNTFRDVYNLQIDNTEKITSLLADKLTWTYDKGPLEKMYVWTAFLTNMNMDFEENRTKTRFHESVINVEFDGTFRGGKEEFHILLEPSSHSNHSYLQPFVQDLFVQTKRIPKHIILVGNSRPGVGYEGGGSPFTLPLVFRSQISRNFSNARKFGLRVRGNYPLVDYDFGGYSSAQSMSSFFPGAEFNAWMNVKPLGKTDGKYGKLTTGGGISVGERSSVDFFVVGAYVGYQYKRFWLRSEYANADGSNGSTGLSRAKRDGWYTTVGYHITKRLEAIARYDEFNPDKTVSHNNKREYTAGINYYLKGQALKIILNYVFCQNQSSPDSHRLLVGTQFLL